MTAVALKLPVGPRRRIAALVGAAMLAAVVVAGCGGEATKDLETLDAPGFSVSMPGKPARSEQPVPTAGGTLKAVSYTSDSYGAAFTIAYSTLPEGSKGNLDGVLERAATNSGGTLRNEVATTYQGYEARDARITGAGENQGTIFVRAIMTKDRLYMLQYLDTNPDVAKPPATYGEILKSLKID